MKKAVKRKIAVLLCITTIMSTVDLGPLAFADTNGNKNENFIATESNAQEKISDELASDSDADEELEYDILATASDADEFIDRIFWPETEIDHDFDLEAAVEELNQNAVMTFASDSEDFWSLLDETARDVRQQMTDRKERITAVLRAGSSDLAGNLSLVFKIVIDEAVKYTGVPNEGDYLSFQIYNWSAYADIYAHRMILTYDVSYYTTAEQEKIVDEKVEALLEKLNPYANTDYKKTKQIYEWICNNIRYSESGMHTTAYNALVNGTCACQGYAVLLYRLLNEAGVPCRILGGYGGDESDYDGTANHCWNAVKMDGIYYYLDVTWDQAYYATKSPYYYFLHGSSDWDQHIYMGNLLDEIAVSSINYPLQENIITAENIYYTKSSHVQNFDIKAEALDDAVLSFRSNSSVITVDSTGMVTIPSDAEETAVITITAAPIHDYKESTKTVTVSAKEAGQISVSLWEKYDESTGEFQNEITSMNSTYGSFSWNNTAASSPRTGKLYVKVSYSGLTEGKNVYLNLTAPDGFSFSETRMETVCSSLGFHYTWKESDIYAWKEIYPIYSENYEDGKKLKFEAELFNEAEVIMNASVNSVPVYKNASEGKIELRNSFSEDGYSDWAYDLNANFSGFAGSSNKYNHQIAKLSAALSAAAYHQYTIIDAFENMGFSNVKCYNYNLNDQIVVNRDQVACAFAEKKYTVANDDRVYTIVAAAIRGTVEEEWYSNFNIGAGYIHQGFLNAEEFVFEQLKNYIDTYRPNADQTKLWITGHSRAAATADLLAGDLNSTYGGIFSTPDNMYTYTFAAPYSLKKDVYYNNIFNIVNYQDLVAHVPGTYCRTGIDKVFNVYCDDSYFGKAYELKKKISSMWENYEYVTWEMPNILEVCDYISADDLMNEYGDAIADLMMKKWLIPSHPEILARLTIRLIKSPQQTLIEAAAVGGTAAIVGPYLGTRIWNNHAIETYIAWMETSNDESELYTDIQKSRILTFKKVTKSSPFSISLLSEAEEDGFDANIFVYDMDGKLVSRIENGELTSTDGPYCIIDGDTAALCLDDREYRIEITGNDAGSMDVIVKEYDENEGETRLVSYLNVPCNSGKMAVLKAGNIPESADTKYSLILPNGEETKADYSSSGEEIDSVAVSVSVTGDGYVIGDGNYTKGEYAVLYAIEENDRFAGWYIDDELVSLEPVYQFICTEDLTAEARFREKDACEANGHIPAEISAKAPTCTETGLTAGSFCSVCGEVLAEQKVIPAAGHTIVIDEAIAATEASAGLTEGSHCSVCGIVMIEQQVIPKLPSGNHGSEGNGTGSGNTSEGNGTGSGNTTEGNGTGSGNTSEGNGTGSGNTTEGNGTGSGNTSGSHGSGSGSGGGASGGGGSHFGGGTAGGGTAVVLKDTYVNSYWVQKPDGTWMLLKADGTAVVGWALKSNKWYYLNPDNGIMMTGWMLINNVWYYLNPSDGAMAEGWIFADNIWYYLEPSSGAMVTGWREIRSKWYYFYPDGRLAVDVITPDGYQVDGNGELIA